MCEISSVLVFFLSLWVYWDKESFINSWILDQILKRSTKVKVEKVTATLVCPGFEGKVDCGRCEERHTDVTISTSTTEAQSYSQFSFIWKLIFCFLGLSLGVFVEKLSFYRWRWWWEQSNGWKQSAREWFLDWLRLQSSQSWHRDYPLPGENLTKKLKKRPGITFAVSEWLCPLCF